MLTLIHELALLIAPERLLHVSLTARPVADNLMPPIAGSPSSQVGRRLATTFLHAGDARLARYLISAWS